LTALLSVRQSSRSFPSRSNISQRIRWLIIAVICPIAFLGGLSTPEGQTFADVLEALPTKNGQQFIVDDWNTKITAGDLGSNNFSGNTGTAESAKWLMKIAMSSKSNDPLGSRPGGSLDLTFNFTGQPNTSYAGYFASLFGLTDTFVSLTPGTQPPATTKFPGYFFNTKDFYRGFRPLQGRTIESIKFDILLETATPITLKIEINSTLLL
jgi:hypothetical protein